MQFIKFASKKKKQTTTLQTKRNRFAYSLLVPGYLFFIPFRLLSIIAIFVMSFVSWKGYSFSTIKWAGLDNFTRLINDPIFWKSLWHTIQFVLIVVVVQTVLALFLAILLEQHLPLTKFIRGIYFMPTVLSLVVVGILFGYIFSPSSGVVNALLRTLGSEIQPHWLGDPKIALYLIMAITTWKEFGLAMFIFIAGLEAIPLDLFDAAKVDGANSWAILRNIILPLIKETTTVVVILTTVNCLKVFDLIWVMTKGGPFYATEVLATRMYTQTFNHGNFGYGSAIASVLFILTFVVSVIQMKVSRSGKEAIY
jgi:ABC-type sugar transport system permease subunit